MSGLAAGDRPSLSTRRFLRDPSFPVRQGDGDLAVDLAGFEVADGVGNAGKSGGAVDDRDDGCRFQVSASCSIVVWCSFWLTLSRSWPMNGELAMRSRSAVGQPERLDEPGTTPSVDADRAGGAHRLSRRAAIVRT
jgi:hypothetical protein